MNHRRRGALRKRGSSPAAHQNTVASISALWGVHVAIGARSDTCPAIHHLLVAANVARRQNHALGSVVLHIFAIRIGDDHACNAAFRIAHKLLGMRVEYVFRTVVRSRLVQRLAKIPVAGLLVRTYRTRFGITHERHSIGIHTPALGKRFPSVFRGFRQCRNHLEALLGNHSLDVVDYRTSLFCPSTNKVVVGGLL